MRKGYLTIALTSLVCPLIIVSNLAVLISVVKTKRLQTPANYFVTSLAVADIFVAISLPLYVTSDLTDTSASWDMFCLVVNRVSMTASAISVLSLAAIAIDRYIAIVMPFEYTWIMTKRKAVTLIFSIYVYGTLVSLTPIFTTWYKEVMETEMCQNKGFNNKSRVLYLIAIFTPSCLCMSFCYLKIYLVARKHAKSLIAVQNIIERRLNRRLFGFDAKYTKTISMVILFFVVFWTPYHTVIASQAMGIANIGSDIKRYSFLFALINSGVNPWIYAYNNKDFRNTFKQILTMHQREADSCSNTRKSSVASEISVVSSNENKC